MGNLDKLRKEIQHKLKGTGYMIPIDHPSRDVYLPKDLRGVFIGTDALCSVAKLAKMENVIISREYFIAQTDALLEMMKAKPLENQRSINMIILCQEVIKITLSKSSFILCK